MRVLAKFKLWEKSERERHRQKDMTDEQFEAQANSSLKLSAVKDAVFGPFTPSGSLEMTVVKSVGDLFVLGQEYYLTFEPVTPDTTAALGLPQ